MTVPQPDAQLDAQTRARSQRIAARERLFDEMIRAAGHRFTDDDAPITEPIPVVGRTEVPASWLSGG